MPKPPELIRPVLDEQLRKIFCELDGKRQATNHPHAAETEIETETEPSRVWKVIDEKTGETIHEDVWQGNPPEAVVFVSNSLRKLFLLFWQFFAQYDPTIWPEFAQKLNVPYHPEEFTDPFSINAYFEKYVRNGDGTLRRPFYIGDLPGGVPLLLCPTDGETDDNSDPVGEAGNKIADIRRHFAGRDVIFFGADSVQDLPTAEGKLGKPIKSELYRSVRERARHSPFGEEDIQEVFKQLYLQRYYGLQLLASVEELEVVELLYDKHLTGLHVERGGVRLTETLVLQIEVIQEHLRQVDVFLESGGGGIFQQLVKRLAETSTEVWKTFDPSGKLAAYLESVPEKHWPYIVYFHIMGESGWILPQLFERLMKQFNESEQSEQRKVAEVQVVT